MNRVWWIAPLQSPCDQQLQHLSLPLPGIDGGPQLGGEIEEKELIGAEGSKKGVLVTHKDHVPVHQTEDVPSPQSPDCNVDVLKKWNGRLGHFEGGGGGNKRIEREQRRQRRKKKKLRYA